MKDKEELYESVVNNIRGMYNGELLEVDAHQAARNFIEFVKILLKHYEKGN